MTTIDARLGPREAWTHPGARALVHLHERELHRFLETWRRARAAGIEMPASQEQHTASLDMLLYHVLRAAGGYLLGLCGMLELAPPTMPELPAPGDIAAGGPAHLEALLEVWRGDTLRGLTGEQADHTTGETPWGVTYCVDGLLEHAVLHPMRHTLQLEQLLGEV